MTDLDLQKGSKAIELARCAMDSYVTNGKRERPGCMKDEFYERVGASIKLQSTRGRRRVRGSGVSYRREKHLSEAIVDAAIDASSECASTDRLGSCELDSVEVTLCVLQEVNETDQPLEDLRVGEHGVIVERGRNHGWLLPTVPVEHGWGAEETLERTSCKARIGRGGWREADATVYTFDGQVFTEREPQGDVAEVELVEQTA
ncbi:MAG: TIGR00296 family protein [Halobacteriota archaeon]